ncbi:PfkB family kinase [Apiospora aurea]|uniref:PfkB family kinase n=1 Tax=Apiospora aurea TaxID=335848 RepID=A0ABR1QUM0_9PEZI
MIVLDELHLPDGQILRDGIGGSGAWSMLGARIAMGRRDAQKVGSFIVAGHDFPESATQVVRRFGVTLEMTVDPTRESTRGKLVYHDNAFNSNSSRAIYVTSFFFANYSTHHADKTFVYLTVPLQPTPAQLPRNLLAARAFHMLLPPEAVMAQVPELLSRRQAAGIREPPFIVWEPLPWKCTPESLEAHKEASKLVSVFSPNHLELLGLFGNAKPNSTDTTNDGGAKSQQAVIKKCGTELFEGVADGAWQGMLVVRCAEMGCFAKSAAGGGLSNMFRPYHIDQKAVVDATGAGNTFLGALAVSLVAAAQKKDSSEQATQHQEVMAAARVMGDASQIAETIVRASVVASFAIEQIGFPNRTMAWGVECWNGESFSTRYERKADDGRPLRRLSQSLDLA